VLDGDSYGALICEVFPAEWPQEAAGLVLVDGSDAQLNIDLGRPLVDDGDKPGTIPSNSLVVAADMFRKHTGGVAAARRGPDGFAVRERQGANDARRPTRSPGTAALGRSETPPLEHLDCRPRTPETNGLVEFGQRS
jgi:pimeloyl-ACP methyl ester carboxylesterase